ncbi:Chemotaxis phosphatase CheX [Tindallia magadiensis]|uniref:Stage 0 sporulation protein A homolog n=1 Tax=Tindallia magadiensis TaxID=69895 RepID=A0A1I3HA96_9FIRM|nr:response regulator [Tindallia magadiensis]SFI32678.1 Chemotaxis phosphatase CheX [Tindallia magadiensis]
MRLENNLIKRVVVVDDSPFSIRILSDMLAELELEVVGKASSLEEVQTVIAQEKPDIVTMDMTIPGTDGIECTEAVKKIHPDARVIMISSMKDDAIVKRSKKAGASGYVQKPVDPEELKNVIHRITSEEEMLQELLELSNDAFQEALMDNINRFSGEKAEGVAIEGSFKESKGVSVVIGVIGAFNGRFVMDFSYQTGVKIVEKVLQQDSASLDDVLNMAAEIANMIAGNACSTINRMKPFYDLRLAPPTVYHGDSLVLSSANVTGNSFMAKTSFGDIAMTVGFAKGEISWT